jgi:tetratricopeptide (TPR) repeat protein
MTFLVILLYIQAFFQYQVEEEIFQKIYTNNIFINLVTTEVELEKGHYIFSSNQTTSNVMLSISVDNYLNSNKVNSLFERGIDEELYFKLDKKHKVKLYVESFDAFNLDSKVEVSIYKITENEGAHLIIEALQLESLASQLIDYNSEKDLKLSLSNMFKAQKIWKNINFKSRLARNQLLSGKISYDLFDWSDSASNFTKAYEFYKNTDNNLYKSSLAATYLSSSLIQLQLFDKASRLLSEAQLIQRTNSYNYELGITENYFGSLAYKNGNNLLAASHFQKAAELFVMPNAQDKKAKAIGNLGLIKLKLGNYNEAISLLRNCIELFDNNQPLSIAAYLSSIALAQEKFGYLQESLITYKEAYGLQKLNNDKAGEAWSLKGMAALSRKIFDYETAISYQKQAIAINRTLINEHGALVTGLLDLAKYYREYGELKENNELINLSIIKLKEVLKGDVSEKFKFEAYLELAKNYYFLDEHKNVEKNIENAERNLNMIKDPSPIILANFSLGKIKLLRNNINYKLVKLNDLIILLKNVPPIILKIYINHEIAKL